MPIGVESAEEIGELIRGFLLEVYTKKTGAYRKMAADYGTSVESIGADALTSILREKGYLRDPLADSEVGDLICTFLHQVYVDNPGSLRKEAAKRGLSAEFFAAAALAGTLEEKEYLRDPRGRDGDSRMPPPPSLN